MRPRHKAAENAAPRDSTPRDCYASMRPRHKAAENEVELLHELGELEGFNEAAA